MLSHFEQRSTHRSDEMEKEPSALKTRFPAFEIAPPGTRYQIKALAGSEYRITVLNTTDIYRYKVSVDNKPFPRKEVPCLLQKSMNKQGQEILVIWAITGDRKSTGPIESLQKSSS